MRKGKREKSDYASNPRIWIVAVTFFLFIVDIIFKIPARFEWLVPAWTADGLLSFIGAVTLGYIAFWQNKRYKELSDENSRKTTEMLFTPECRLIQVRASRLGYESVQIACLDPAKYHGKDVLAYFTTLNLPMIDITIASYSYREKGNQNHQLSFEHKDLLFSYSFFTELRNYEQFVLQITIPDEFLNVDTICDLTLHYKNIYDAKISKVVSFERNGSSGELLILKQEKAKMIEETT